MTDVKNRIEVLDRYRDGVSWIRYLADEAAVFAHRMREPNAHAGRP
jgi:hypothetical protein